MIAAAAYFQASGVMSLVAHVWTAGARGAAPPAPARAGRAAAEEDPHSTSAAAILSRNPFDSRTGPLDRAPVAEAGPAPEVDGDPLDDPECEGVRALLIVASDDPGWSFAALAAGREPARLRRQGDVLSGKEVRWIGSDRVWLSGDGARCQVLLRSRKAAPAAAKAPAPSAGPKRSRRGAVPPEIASKIHKVSDREFNVDRSVVDQVIEQQGELMRSMRARPVKKDGKVAMRLLRVPEDSLLGSLGMKTGDQIRSINGFELADPQKALELYARLRSASDLAVTLERGGKDMTIDIHLR
ncbi:MAG: general secretion pathway protein GspC [Polyangiaceae bacterium]|nr:general secretion pathway protein GspC [Polyangiaceae bacterium]